MVFLHRFLQSRTQNVGVDLGCRYVGVAQHRLHAAQIRAPLQQMCGKGMADYVGGQATEDADFPSVHGQQFPERLAGQFSAPGRHKQVSTSSTPQQAWAGSLQVLTDGSKGGPNQSGGSLPNDASMAGWATPAGRDSKGFDPKGKKNTRQNPESYQPMDSGEIPATSTAGTGSGEGCQTKTSLLLNPAFSGWLQNYPVEWTLAGLLAHFRSRKKSKAE